MNNNLTTFYIVRHGESESNVKALAGDFNGSGKVLGSSLTDKGKQQAKLISQKFRDLHFDAIFSSHLIRAKDTAEEIAKNHNIAVITKEALKERVRGTLTGRNETELQREIGSVFGNAEKLSEKEMWKGRLADDMESAEEVISRFITALREISVAYPGKQVLLVSHGNVMRSFLVHLGYATFKELPAHSLENTGYFILESDGVDFFLREVHGINKKS